MSDLNTKHEPRPLEKAVFSYTDDRLAGIAFLMSMPLIFLLRFRIGIRILRVDMGALLIFCLSVISYLSDWISNLPIIGSSRQMDLAMWKLFIGAFALLFAIQLVSAYREIKRNKLYTYTRSLGRSRLWPLFRETPLKFIKTELDFQIFIEPVIALVGSIMLGELAPNLGTFLGLSSMCLFVVGWKIRSNMLNLRHDANDAAIVSDVVIQGESEVVNKTAKMATGSSKKATHNRPNDNDDVYI